MTDDRVMRILKQVENKEISPDDAAKLIEDLEADSLEIDNVQTEKPRSAACEAKNDLRDAMCEVGEELKDAASEIQEELQEAAHEVKEDLKDAKRDVSEALKEVGDLNGLVDGLNGMFSGLGEALRNMFSGGFGFDSSGFRKFEFVEVREGSFTAESPELDFSNHNGKVKVDSWDNDTYRLEVKKIIAAPDEDQARKRAQESILVADSPDGLKVHLVGHNTRGVSVSIRATVPSHLRYSGKLKFHNGDVSLEKLQMKGCEMNLHNGKFSLRDLAAEILTTSCHNGKAHLEHVEAGECHVSMHNGKMNGDVKCSKLTASMHNGEIGLGLSTRDRLECVATAHNGKIHLGFEKADDTGYRVEYEFDNGKAHVSELAESMEEIESVRPKHGSGKTKWIGQSPGFGDRARKISSRCSVHNGKISVGWMA